MAPTRVYVEDADTAADTKIFTTRAALPQTLAGLTNDVEHVVVNTAASPVVTPSATVTPPAETTTLTPATGFEAVVAGAVTTVQHADGPICIVSASPITIREATPETTGTGAALRNGHVVNPGVSADGSQSYDGRRPLLAEANVASFPLVLNPGDVLILTKSWAGAPFSGTQPQRCGYTEEAVMIYVSAVAPAAGSLAPAAISWAGRASMDTPSVVDYAARAAALPVSFGVTGETYPTLEQVRRALRFNPFPAQRQATNDTTGYETFYPTLYGQLTPATSTNWNYGRQQGRGMELFGAALLAPLAQVPIEVKAEILMRMDSLATQNRQVLQGMGGRISPNGAHQQFEQLPMVIQDWLRGRQPDLTNMMGNFDQAYIITQQDVIDSENGFGDPDLLNEVALYPDRMWYHHWRKIAAIDPLDSDVFNFETWRNSGTGTGDDQYPGWSPALIIRQSDGAEVTIVSDSNPGSGLTGGKQAVARARVAAQPTPPLAADDVIRFRAIDDLVAGDVIWRERPSRANSAVPTGSGRYQNQQNWGFLLAIRALGLVTDAMLPAWRYFIRANESANPASDDFPGMLGSNAIVQGLYATHLAAITAVPQPYLSAVSEDPFYPDVPPVDMEAAAGSVAFPEGNNGPAAATFTTEKGLLAVSRTNIAALPASTSPQAIFAVLRLPKGKRAVEATFGIFGQSGSGGNRVALKFGADANGLSAERGKFRGYFQGNTGSTVNIQSAEWTEDACLLVFHCDGANNWAVDWYSLETGQRFAGPISTISAGNNFLNGGPSTTLAIGGNTTSAGPFTSNGGGFQWPGEIEALGIAFAAVTPAQWASIALGADIVDTIGGANLRFLRDFDGSPASYARLPEATGDTSSDVYAFGGTEPSVPASKIMRGSHIRRQDPTAWLTMQGLTHGHLYGLRFGEVDRDVPFSGRSGSALEGQPVEIRVIEAETGLVVRDWTVVGTASNGAWSGTLLLPRTPVWWVAQARCGGVLCDRRDEFGVGYKVMGLGQSQFRIARQGNPVTSGVPLSHPNTMTFVTNYFYSDRPAMMIERNRMTNSDTTGLRAFVNQWRQFDDTLIMYIDETVAGTSSQQLIDDSQGQRSWADLQAKLDAVGNDVSLILINWGTAEAETGVDAAVMADRWDAMFFGEGPLVQDHSMQAALQPGWVIAVSPLTRHTTNYGTAIGNIRRYQVDWAHARGVAVGPPVSDLRIEAAGGPHQIGDDVNGNRVMMARLALAGLKALGLADFQQPHFTTVSRAGAVITVSVALPNGGSLFSRSPSALRSFTVNGSTSGFTAAVAGNTVTLTKTTGVWSAGDVVAYSSNLQDRAGGDSAAEAAIMETALYETWADDVVTGWGLPVLGGLDGSGNWVPDWSAVAA